MEPVEAAEPMSLGGRLMNVFAAPSEVFESVAKAPFTVMNWLVPAILVGVIGAIAAFLVFSNPVLIQEVRDIQDQELQKAVDAGKMRAEDMEQAKQVMGGIGMVIARVVAVVGGLTIGFVGPLWWGFIAWLVARFAFQSRIGYFRAVEVAGLASLIGCLGSVVGLFLAIGMGRLMAGPHLGLLVSDFDMSNRAHIALAAVNVFNLWQTALLSLGIAKLIGRPFLPVALVIFGVWAGYKGIAVALGLLQFAL